MTTQPVGDGEKAALRPPARRGQDRSLIASIASAASWAKTPDFAARTEKARKAMADRFERQVREQFPDLDDAQIAIRAEHAKKAYYLRLALKSAQARRAKGRKGPKGRDGERS